MTGITNSADCNSLLIEVFFSVEYAVMSGTIDFPGINQLPNSLQTLPYADYESIMDRKKSQNTLWKMFEGHYCPGLTKYLPCVWKIF